MLSASIVSRRTAALAAAGVLTAAVACACIMPAQAHAARSYGTLCSKYESNNNPALVDSGAAYGAYQMSPGNAYSYAKWLAAGADKDPASKSFATCVQMGESLVSAYKKDKKSTGKKFDAAWAACSKKDKTLFFNTQYTYCKKHYYSEAVTYWKKVAPGFSTANYSTALRAAIFSTAVQHGPYGSAYYIFKKALKDVGGWKKGMGEDVLINAIYYERSKVTSTAPAKGAVKITSTNIGTMGTTNRAKDLGIYNKYLVHFYSCGAPTQVSVYDRLHNDERKAALSLMVKSGGKCSHSVTTGGKALYKASKSTETTHSVAHTAVTCTICKATVKKATSYKDEAHEFEYKGASYKCACGEEYAVHTAGKRYTCIDGANIRSKASTKGKKLGVLYAGKTVKVTQTKVGNDHDWWGKISYGGKTGWVHMEFLSIHGSGSTTGHVYKNGVCKYCKTSKSVIENNTAAGTYKTTKATYYYKAAFSKASKSSSIAKGKKVTIKKVVRNTYNQLWGQTLNGKYVNLAYFKK